MKIERFKDRFEKIDNEINEKFKGVIQGNGIKRTISANAPIRKKVLGYINDNPGISRNNLETFLKNNGIKIRWIYNNKDYVYRSKDDSGYRLTKLGKAALKLYTKYDTYKQELRDEIRDDIMRELTTDAITHMNVSIFEDLTNSPRHMEIKTDRLIENLWMNEDLDEFITERSDITRKYRNLNEEQSELQKKYKEYFMDLLKDFDAESVKDLSKEEKIEFFNAIKDGWIKGEGPKKKKDSK